MICSINLDSKKSLLQAVKDNIIDVGSSSTRSQVTRSQDARGSFQESTSSALDNRPIAIFLQDLPVVGFHYLQTIIAGNDYKVFVDDPEVEKLQHASTAEEPAINNKKNKHRTNNSNSVSSFIKYDAAILVRSDFISAEISLLDYEDASQSSKSSRLIGLVGVEIKLVKSRALSSNINSSCSSLKSYYLYSIYVRPRESHALFRAKFNALSKLIKSLGSDRTIIIGD